MSDWEETAFSNRHVHNRRGRNPQGKASKRAVFDVRRTFGSYEVKCSTAAKLMKEGETARLEVYCLNEDQNAMYAEITFPGLLHAVVLLAGSRKVMNNVISGLVSASEESGQGQRDTQANETVHDSDNEDRHEDESMSEDQEEHRAREFEKNSFRSPKFWMKWQGELLKGSNSDQPVGKLETDNGYLVFNGNACEKFDGTISCAALKWDNVKIKGFKVSTKSDRDFYMQWQPT